MAIRTVTGFAGPHPLDGPGIYMGAKVAGSNLAAKVSISAQSKSSGAVLVNQAFAAGSTVGTALPGGIQLPQDAQLIVTLANAADRVDVDMSGPYG